MNVGVIFAGGVGRRMNNNAVPKQFLQLNGKPIIIYTLEVFQNCPDVDAICIASLSSHIDYLKELCSKFCITKVKWIVPGGATSMESTFNALNAVYADCPRDTVVMIHDGVRPIISSELLQANIRSVREHGSGVSCAWATETPALVGEEGKIVSVAERKQSVIAKAPQSFLLGEIYDAHIRCQQENLGDFIDSASMMRYFGKELHMVECAWDNIKITNPSDYYIFKAIVEARENSRIFGY